MRNQSAYPVNPSYVGEEQAKVAEDESETRSSLGGVAAGAYEVKLVYTPQWTCRDVHVLSRANTGVESLGRNSCNWLPIRSAWQLMNTGYLTTDGRV